MRFSNSEIGYGFRGGFPKCGAHGVLQACFRFVLSLSLAGCGAAGVAGGSPAPACSAAAAAGCAVAELNAAELRSARPSRPSRLRARPVRRIRRLPARRRTPTPPPGPVGRVVPSNRVANAPSSGYDETSGIIRVNVNAVPVPVTVKDATGRLFPGLTKDNFSVYEDGVKQRISFFTSDPFPVSAAIIIDVGMPEIALRKVKETFPALVGSFSQFDELSIYTYGNTVKQQQDYLAALGDTTTRTLTPGGAAAGKQCRAGRLQSDDRGTDGERTRFSIRARSAIRLNMRRPRMRSLRACSTTRWCAPPWIWDTARRHAAGSSSSSPTDAESARAPATRTYRSAAAGQQRERVRRGGRCRRHPGVSTSWKRFACRARATTTSCRSTPRRPAEKSSGSSPEQALESAYGSAMEEAQKPVHAGVQHVGNGFHLLPQDRGSGQRLRSEPEGVRPRRLLSGTAETVEVDFGRAPRFRSRGRSVPIELAHFRNQHEMRTFGTIRMRTGGQSLQSWRCLV